LWEFSFSPGVYCDNANKHASISSLCISLNLHNHLPYNQRSRKKRKIVPVLN
jgi:hypothetical protein